MSPADEAVTASPTPTAEAENHPADWDACDHLAPLLVPAQDVISAIVEDPSGATIDVDQLHETADGLRLVLAYAETDEMSRMLDDFSAPILSLQDIFNGGENQTLDTGAYRDAAIDLLSYCVDDVGYRAD